MTKICGGFEPSTDGSKCEIFEDTIRAAIRGNTSKDLTGFYRIGCGTQCTEVRFASFHFGGFTTMAVINPPERKLANAPLCSGGEGTKICQNW